MSRMRLWALVILGLSLAGQPAAAQTTLLYEFADATGAAQTTFNVAPGATIPIRLYMRETTAGAPLMSSVTHDGMGGASVRVTFGTGAIAAVNVLTDITAAQGNSVIAGRTLWDFVGRFVEPPAPAAPTAARLIVGKNVANSPLPSGVVPADFGETQRIFLGTFLFTGKTAGQLQLVASDTTANPGDTANFDGFTLDGVSTPPPGGVAALASGAIANLIVAVPVPEPGSMAFAGLGIAGLIAYRRRKAMKS
jgi:PEP-CTERM motif